MKIKSKVTKKFMLNGTIDGHDPIGVTRKVTCPEGTFWITFITVNWGRGYNPGEFKANVLAVLDKVEGRHFVVLLIQELDEADAAPERKIFIMEMEPGTTLVPEPPTPGRETIAVSPDVEVTRKRRVMTMDQGTKIGAPVGTGPRRFAVSCIIHIMGVRIGLLTTHPHRALPNKAVVKARQRGQSVVRDEVRQLVGLTDFTEWGGDMNDRNFPKMHPREDTDNERGLDTLRHIGA